MPTAISDGEYQRRYDLIAQHHLNHHAQHGTNPWMSAEPDLRAWTVAFTRSHVPAEASILDAGCGIGQMAADLGAVGVDISADYIAHARTLGVDGHIGWIEHLPFPDDSFDAAICCDVFEHLRNPDICLTEIRRVVRQGGTLVVRVPDGEATGVGADSGFGFPVHFQSWTEPELAAFLGGTKIASEIEWNELLMAVTL